MGAHDLNTDTRPEYTADPAIGLAHFAVFIIFIAGFHSCGGRCSSFFCFCNLKDLEACRETRNLFKDTQAFRVAVVVLHHHGGGMVKGLSSERGERCPFTSVGATELSGGLRR